MFQTGSYTAAALIKVADSAGSTVCHLGHVTSIMSIDFHFLVPESFHTKFGSDRHSSLRISCLNFCMYTTLGLGQEMTLTFNTHISSYIQLDVCSY